jgi:hypothetical protein
MSFVTTGQRVKNLFNPDSREPFKLSRAKLEFFTQCPRCFYLDRRLGVGQPPPFPFTLNSAVDALLKKEFDIHRAEGSTHPLMEAYGIRAVPLRHESLNEWRNNFKGMQYYHRPTNFVITGAVDDIWQTKQGELIVVDYKATSTDGEITLDAEYRGAYKRQMEVYQWLLRQNHFTVSDTGYFVYANGKKDRRAFDGKLEFDVQIIPYTGNAGWVEGALHKIRACLTGGMPALSSACAYCLYRRAAAQYEEKP